MAKIDRKWLTFLVKNRRLMFDLANSIIPQFPYGEGSCWLDANNKGSCWWMWRCENWAFIAYWRMDDNLLSISFEDFKTEEKLDFEYEIDLLEGEIL